MSENPSVVIPPDSLPLSVQEFKAYLGIKSDDDYQDFHIHRSIKSCVAFFEDYLERSLSRRTLLKRFSAFSESMELNNGPVSSIVSIEYQDQNDAIQTIDPANYVLDSVSLVDSVKPASGYCWPTPISSPGSVSITYVAGYAELPDNILQAMNITIDNWVRYQSNNASGTLVTTIPYAAMQLISTERVWGM